MACTQSLTCNNSVEIGALIVPITERAEVKNEAIRVMLAFMVGVAEILPSFHLSKT